MLRMTTYTSDQLENWADKLLAEYDESLAALHETQKRVTNQDKRLQECEQPIFHKPLKSKKEILNSMERSMVFAMDWMENGRNPDLKRGVDKHAVYQRQFFESLDVIPDIAEQVYSVDLKELQMTEEQKKQLAKIFASWSHRERYCFIANTVEGKSFQKIADELKISKGTVQSYIQRARTKLAENIQKKIS